MTDGTFKPTSGWHSHVEDAIDRGLLVPLCKAITKDAKRYVPVRTGDLKRDITWEVYGGVGRVGSNLKYSEYVERGTPQMAAQPYLRPALYRVRTAL